MQKRSPSQIFSLFILTEGYMILRICFINMIGEISEVPTTVMRPAQGGDDATSHFWSICGRHGVIAKKIGSDGVILD